MINEKEILDMLKAGKTADEIAREMTDILNQAEKTYNENTKENELLNNIVEAIKAYCDYKNIEADIEAKDIKDLIDRMLELNKILDNIDVDSIWNRWMRLL